MKTLKISENLSVKVCETLEDLNIKRFIASKEYILMAECGLSMPSVKQTYQKFINAFDQDSKARMLLCLHEFTKGIMLIEEKEEPYQMLFALMTLSEGEEVTNTDKTILKEKLDKYAAEGLTHGVVMSETEAFMKAFRSK